MQRITSTIQKRLAKKLLAPRDKTPRIRCHMVGAMTGTGTNEWTTESLSLGTFNKAYGWEVYKTALLNRGVNSSQIVETATQISFVGDAAINFISFFPRYQNFHYTPKNIQAKVKAVSRVHTKFGIFHDYQAVGQFAHYSWPAEQLRQALIPYWEVGTGLNTYGGGGATSIDQYETSAPNNMPLNCNQAPNPPTGAFADVKPHSWNIDLLKVDINNYCNLLAALDKSDQGQDFHLFDNVFEFNYYGSATNAPVRTNTSDASYNKKFVQMFDGLRSRGIYDIWGNAYQRVGAYNKHDLPGRFVEFWFALFGAQSRTVADLQSDIKDLRVSGLELAVQNAGSTVSATDWCTTRHAGWPYLKKTVDQWGLWDQFTVVNARTGFQLYCQPEFEQPI